VAEVPRQIERSPEFIALYALRRLAGRYTSYRVHESSRSNAIVQLNRNETSHQALIFRRELKNEDIPSMYPAVVLRLLFLAHRIIKESLAQVKPANQLT
jgi:hypothetical protein